MGELPGRGLELAISASKRQPSIALRRADGEICIATPTQRPAGDLSALIAETFAGFGHQPNELSRIRLDLGPGSYTGLRVAVTFARTMLSFNSVAVQTCTSLQLLALATIEQGLAEGVEHLRPVLDARRQRYHHGLVAATGLQLLQPPAAEPLDSLLAKIEAGELVVAAPELHPLLMPTTLDRRATLVEPPAWSAALLFDERLALRETAAQDLEPLYLMGSYAEP